jgi:hypothetical protein
LAERVKEQLGPRFAITEILNEKPGTKTVPYREFLKGKFRHKTATTKQPRRLTAKP